MKSRTQIMNVFVGMVVLAGLAGCGEDLMEQRPDPLLGQTTDVTYLNEAYESMVQNGAAHSLVVADGHFVPHTAQLNGLGHRQLDRLALHLERYGGTIHYETRSKDEGAISARIKNIEEYFTDTGMDMSNIVVEAGLSRGRGIGAKDAIESADRVKEAGESSSSGAYSSRDLPGG